MDIRSLGISVLAALLGAGIAGSGGAAGSTTALVPGAALFSPDGTVRQDSVALALQSGPAGSALRLAPGRKDRRGCRSLVVWRGSQRIKVIPSHRAGCSRTKRIIEMGGRLYFEWFVERTLDGGGWSRRTDLWVTDGTRAGTDLLTTMRSGRGPDRNSCESRWARAGGNAIAAAQWCWDPRSWSWRSGRVEILIRGRLVRTLPIPRPWRFRMAGRRIVTTGADERGRELWVHDGRMVRVDIRPGWRGSHPRHFEDLGGVVRFTANDGTGRAVWVTDGTREGTYKVRR